MTPMTIRKVALLTAGGFAPCLSSAVGGLIERYTELAPDIEIIAYENGYQGRPCRMIVLASVISATADRGPSLPMPLPFSPP